ncbi:unnamed protein product [Owenia fusiformis]|uniref:Acid sphingomyelinase-like phosphodiesterase 3b n=1 Tax=Owenia fusiformis TaxID=6347 RepID=A0A8S4N0L5_OWEFU|nr:unnamed protein product [Owenia fusiformis]
MRIVYDIRWNVSQMTLLGIIFQMMSCSANIGSFWHVSDFHYDPTYDMNATAESCPSSLKRVRFGRFGDYLCDAPWALVNDSVYAMKSIEPNPDFIIWTGDDTPHIYTGPTLNTKTVIDIILNETQLLQDVFPNTIVYAALGNHDYHPKNQLPDSNNTIYDAVLEKWKIWMKNPESEQTFRKGGYYTESMYKNGYRVIVLNTNLYYTSNNAIENKVDPAEQFAWMENVLENSKKQGEKVHIVGHIPVGLFEKHAKKYWFRPEYNRRMNDIIVKYSDIILGQYFAHHHTDSFRLFYNKGKPLSTAYLAPAVTPWATTLPGVVGSAANNPGIRLFKYDSTNTEPTDIWQYYLNLTEANTLERSEWKILYKARKDYNLTSLLPVSWDTLVESFKTTDSETFRKYIDFNGVGFSKDESCENQCKHIHICAIRNVDYNAYDRCINSASIAGKPLSTAYLAPAVTPWATTLPGVVGSAANNPGIRLFKYDSTNTEPTDIWQYYLNLTEANTLERSEWKILYKARKDYNLTSLLPVSWDTLVESFKTTDSETFRKYIDFNGVGFSKDESCENQCKHIHICAIRNVDYNAYDRCINSASIAGVFHFVSIWTVVIPVLFSLIFVK